VYSFNDTIRDCLCHDDDTIVCLNSSPFELKFCSPEGGKYHGAGISGPDSTTFEAATAGLGSHNMTYVSSPDICYFTITVINIGPAGEIGNIADSIVCLGDIKQYQINPIPNAESYIWNLTNSPLLNFSTTNPYIPITFDDTYHSGQLTVKGQNKCGTGDESPPFAITVNPRPTFSIVDENGIVISGEDTVVCKNSRNTYKASILDVIYQWKVEAGGSISGDSTDQFVTVDWNKPGSIGILKLTVIDDNGCSGTDTQNFEISNTEAPLIPQIWQFGTNILVCSDSTATSYEWKIGQEPKSTKQYCIVEDVNQINNYRVKICYGNCCNETSTGENRPIPMNSSAFPIPADEAGRLNITIFPNPARDKLYIKSNEMTLTGFEYKIFGQVGGEILAGEGRLGMAEVNLSNLPAGLYFIEVRSESSFRIYNKFIKY
jgi:hypothetical protein